MGTMNLINSKADVETNVVLGTGDVGIASIMAEAKNKGPVISLSKMNLLECFLKFPKV